MSAALSITTIATATVPWVPFRRALCAVVPHASKDADWPALRRVRIDLRPDGTVLVGATDRFTVAMAHCAAHVAPDERHLLDLAPEEVRKVLAVFPEMKEDLDYTLQLVASTEQLEVRDVSGMVDGERLAVNLLPATDDVPNMAALLSKYLHRDCVEVSRPSWALEYLSRFKAATKCWTDPNIRLSMVGLNSALVFVGDDFVGLASGVDLAGDTDRDRDAWAQVLADDLPPAERMAGVVNITDFTTEITPTDEEPTP